MLTAVFAQLLVIVSVCVMTASGHGRLVDPPSRASMFRYGFDNPADWGDNQGWCGGMQNQWNVNGGKCGICGDPYQGPRTHEPGQDNIYANGIIVKNYQMDQVIEVEIQITAHHKGYFEFRLCPSQDPLGSVTQSCLDRFLLELEDGGTRFSLPAPNGPANDYSVRLRLPSGLKCSHCVLQWHYNTGNSWGCDADGNCGLGLGAQENFRACADISVSGSGTPLPTSSPSPSTTAGGSTVPDETTALPTTAQTSSPSHASTTIAVATTEMSPSSLSSSSSTTPAPSPSSAPSSPQPNSTPTVDTSTVASTSSASTTAKDTTEDSSTATVTTTDTSVPGCACTYRSAGAWAGSASIDSWCVLMCPGFSCDHWSGCERYCPDSC